LEAAVDHLVYGYGMLTDQAQWIVAEKTASAGFMTLRTFESRALVAPMNQRTKSAQRYMLSSSQLALLRFNYGFEMAQPADGDGFDATCVQFLEFVLLGACGCTMGELVEVLGLHGVVAPQRSAVLTHTAVRVLQATTMIHPCGELLEHLGLRAEEMPAAHEVLVIRNAPRASFANVIVIFPRVGVLLIQNTFYTSAKMFGEADATLELERMGMALVDQCGLRKTTVEVSSVEVITKLCDDIPLATASKCFPQFVTGQTVCRKKLLEHLKAVGGAVSVPTEALPLGGLHDCLRSVAACGEDHGKIWVRFCLMTTTERIGTLPSEVLQFHATRDTLFPIQLPTRSTANYVEVRRFDMAEHSKKATDRRDPGGPPFIGTALHLTEPHPHC
jgi:hypothetical protein